MRNRYSRIVITAIALAAGAVISHAYAVSAGSATQRSQVLESYGKLPLSFEANQGQANPDINFISRGHGYTLLLTGNQAILGLKPQGSTGTPAVVRMQLADANSAPRFSGVDQLPGIANYFVGHDPAKWHSNIPTYARVKYGNVYPGVDLFYYGNQQQLEYDFVVQPHGDPAVIALNFSGSSQGEKTEPSKLVLDDKGNLLVETSAGTLRFNKPVVYQADAKAAKHYIDAQYVLGPGSKVSFAVGAYDRSRTLVIDPSLAYSTYLGGTVTDVIKDVALDALENAYVVGSTFSSNFPTTVGALDTSCGGCTTFSDSFVAKINPAGSALVYSTYLGGNNTDSGGSVAVDVSGNAYVGGFTQSTDFPVTGSAFQSTLKGSQDGTLTKLDASGSALLYSTFLGGSGKDQILKVLLDGSANAYVTGFAQSSNFPVTAGVFQSSFGGGTGRGDAFVAKMNPSASGAASLVWSTYLGGSSDDTGASLALDASGDVFVTGGTKSTNFPTTTGAFQRTLGGLGDIYVTELNPTGSALVYSTYIGGSAGEEAFAMALDASGNAYVVGATDSPNFPATVGALQTTYGGNSAPIQCNFSFFTTCGDAFAVKVNSTGTALSYATYLGGGGSDYAAGVKVDNLGNAYITGATNSTNFPTVKPLQPSFLGVTDVIVSILNPAGSALTFSTYLGGRQGEGGTALTLDTSLDIYVVGFTESPDYPLQNPIQGTYGGGKDDGFVTKISPTGGATLLKTTIIFNPQLVGTTSPSKRDVLTNGSSTTLTINGITVSGTNASDFSQTNTCGTSLPAGESCNIDINFSPTFGGARQAQVVINDSDPTSPQRINVKGIGSYVKFSRSDVIFGNQQVGTSSAPKQASLINISPSTSLTITGVTMTGANPGDFSQTNNCPVPPNTLAPGASCIFTVTFTPTQVGNRQANVSVASSDPGSPSKLVLKGAGIN